MTRWHDADDTALMRGICDRDHEALAALYDRHRPLALRIAYRAVGASDAAEDVVHDSFLAVWQRAHTYCETSGQPRQWLASIVRNRAIDRLRLKANAPTAVLDDTLPADSSVFAAVAAAMDARAVRRALLALPAEQRQVLELAFWGGLTTREIAERAGVPQGTVKSRMRLAFCRLRPQLAQLRAA